MTGRESSSANRCWDNNLRFLIDLNGVKDEGLSLAMFSEGSERIVFSYGGGVHKSLMIAGTLVVSLFVVDGGVENIGDNEAVKIVR